MFDLIFYLIFGLIVIWALYMLFRKESMYITYPCNCDLERDKCHQRVKITHSIDSFNSETDMNETFKCGKVKKQLKEIEKIL